MKAAFAEVLSPPASGLPRAAMAVAHCFCNRTLFTRNSTALIIRPPSNPPRMTVPVDPSHRFLPSKPAAHRASARLRRRLYRRWMRAPLKYSLSPIYAQKQRHGVELLADPGMMVRRGDASMEGKAALSMRPSADVYKPAATPAIAPGYSRPAKPPSPKSTHAHTVAASSGFDWRSKRAAHVVG